MKINVSNEEGLNALVTSIKCFAKRNSSPDKFGKRQLDVLYAAGDIIEGITIEDYWTSKEVSIVGYFMSKDIKLSLKAAGKTPDMEDYYNRKVHCPRLFPAWRS